MAKMQHKVYGGLTVTIEGESGDLDAEEFITAAIRNLIEAADTDHWRKHDFDAAYRFYDAILSDVARHFYGMYSEGNDVPADMRVDQLLEQLIMFLRDDGRLQGLVREDDLEDDE